MFVKPLPVLMVCLALAAAASAHPGHVQAAVANATKAADEPLEQQSSNTTQCHETQMQNATTPRHPEPLSWKTVPDCTIYANPVLDTYNNTWAFDVVFNRSCAVRGSRAVKQVPAFDAATACKHLPNNNNSSPDSYGHLWGWQNNASCAFKNANGKPIVIIPVKIYSVPLNRGRRLQQAVAQASATATADGSKGKNAVAVANSDAEAAATGPNSSSTSIATSNAAATNGTAIAASHADSRAEQNATSLAIAATNSTATQGGVAIADKSASAQAAANSSAFDIQVGTASDAAVTWETAPTCPNAPSASNSIKDASGRLWGATSDGRSCAFKYSDGKHVYSVSGGSSSSAYTAGVSVTWQAAPACKLQPPTNARIDTSGRLWGWENGASCKYVDAAGNAVLVASSSSPAAASSASASASANANANTPTSPSPSATSAGVPSDSLSPSPVPSIPEPAPAHGSSYASASALAASYGTAGNGAATASASASPSGSSKYRKAARRSLAL